MRCFKRDLGSQQHYHKIHNKLIKFLLMMSLKRQDFIICIMDLIVFIISIIFPHNNPSIYPFNKTFIQFQLIRYFKQILFLRDHKYIRIVHFWSNS